MLATNENTLVGFTAILFVSLLSFVGVITLATKSKKIPNLYTMLVAFATGALIGTAIYHLLPQSVDAHRGFTNSLGTLLIVGIFIPFVLEKAVNWHHHHAIEHTEYGNEEPAKLRAFVYVNIMGDGLHNFIDGAVIIATFTISQPLGFATLLGIIIHETAQELGDFSILIAGGLETRRALLLNFASAMVAILGGIAALFFQADTLAKYLVPIAAGNFLYLAIGDLIPELNRGVHRKDWISQIMLGSFGAGLMYLLTFIEA